MPVQDYEWHGWAAASLPVLLLCLPSERSLICASECEPPPSSKVGIPAEVVNCCKRRPLRKEAAPLRGALALQPELCSCLERLRPWQCPASLLHTEVVSGYLLAHLTGSPS